MKRTLFFLPQIFLVFVGMAQVNLSNLPVSNLRATAYPLLTIDPYFSAWSCGDNLYDEDVTHWTGERHPLVGAVRVDDKVYRFMGKEQLEFKSIIKDSREEKWQALYTTNSPLANWYSVNFNADKWQTGVGAFGTSDKHNVGTLWTTDDLWVRRSFDFEDDNYQKKDLYLVYSHDDVFELYINGRMIVNTGLSWNNHVYHKLDTETVRSLKKEGNVIAAHCHNTSGGGFVDFGIYEVDNLTASFANKASQVFVTALPTQTYYSFYCGPVQLDLCFTSPLILQDLNLLSSPVNYISYEIRSLDNQSHDVQIYFEATPDWAVNTRNQEVETEMYSKNGMNYIKTGTKEQHVLGKSGDIIRIDWGYFYLSSKQKSNSSMTIGNGKDIKSDFAEKGFVNNTTTRLSGRVDNNDQALVYIENMGTVSPTQSKSGRLMIGYDDVESIQYFGQNLKAYWKSSYKTIEDAFVQADRNYHNTMKACADWDKKVMEDAYRAGGQQYAEICALSYRQAVSAHKLVLGPKGELFFFSKENNSNGCIGTVDVTYPSVPLFLLYNTEIAKAMLEFIFDYSESGRWKKPFPAHDIGTYPLANGQTYSEDMPVEEAGNMLIMTTAIAIIENDASYAEKHWKTLTTWANYLMEKGMDPENQLCTEDFAGHLAHNANLSAKAIMGIAGYGKLSEMLNKKSAKKFTQTAKDMAIKWDKMADDGDHYRLAFNLPDTWSQKYNFIWDKVLNLNIIPKHIFPKEIAFYLKQQNEFGLPLDNRFTWTKIEGTIWTATMAATEKDFTRFVIPLWKYVNETPSRVPLGDWHESLNASYINFRARSVVGGVYLKSLQHFLHNR